MIKIVEYKDEYAKELSEIILSNMYQINIKDHGKDVIDKIGKKLIEKIDNIAINIWCKELIIPASVYACEFYRKFGFDYLDNRKIQNEDKEYILIKKY